MRKNPIFLIGIGCILIAAMVGGILFAVATKKKNTAEPTTGEQESTNGIHFEHTTGEPVIEFGDGNEIFFDVSLTKYLERMEMGVPAVDDDGNYYFDKDGDIVYDTSKEKELDPILDNLILLVNHFAKHGYSMEASQQIQRFYVMYYDRFSDVSFDTLADRIAQCFPTEGADPETLPESILNVFGFNRGDDFAFVFRPVSVAEIQVQFYNVLPAVVTIDPELELMCIYDNWRHEENDGYERNLEGWLHNVIQVTSEAGLSEEKIIVAQILYAGSLADAEYCPDWKESLIRCMTVEDWSFDSLKLAVESEFGVCIDYNVPLIGYFENISEVN